MRMTWLLSLGLCLGLLAPAAAEDKDKLDPEKLVGTWVYVSGERNGEKVDPDRLKDSVVFTKDKITLKGEMTFVLTYTLDTTKSPCQIKMKIVEGPVGVDSAAEGIITVKDDELKICYAMPEQPAPKEFAAKKDSMHHLFVLKRKK